MTTFLLDLWQDLRAKRLWPIAIGLLAATIAVPAFLFKPASTPPDTGATQASDQDKLPAVTLDASSVAESHLDVFKEKNPFGSMADAPPDDKSDGGGGGDAGAGGAGSGDAAGGAGSSPIGGTGGSTPIAPSLPNGPDGNPVGPGVHYFTYTADVRFGTPGGMKSYKSLMELDVLPDGDNPIISFMGVRDANTAMFFIADPAFRVDGEGECAPSPDNCMFLYLKKDGDKNEATLSAQDGEIQYDLVLTGLHVKNLDRDSAVGDTTPDETSDSAARRNMRVRETLLSMPALGLAKRKR